MHGFLLKQSPNCQISILHLRHRPSFSLPGLVCYLVALGEFTQITTRLPKLGFELPGRSPQVGLPKLPLPSLQLCRARLAEPPLAKTCRHFAPNTLCADTALKYTLLEHSAGTKRRIMIAYRTQLPQVHPLWSPMGSNCTSSSQTSSFNS